MSFILHGSSDFLWKIYSIVEKRVQFPLPQNQIVENSGSFLESVWFAMKFVEIKADRNQINLKFYL